MGRSLPKVVTARVSEQEYKDFKQICKKKETTPTKLLRLLVKAIIEGDKLGQDTSKS